MGYTEDAKDDPYCYPGTHVLTNLLGLKEQTKLEKAETDFILWRQSELDENPIQGGFDLKHLQSIHRHLFQDVYSWAGELRKGDISKEGSRFASHQFLESAGDKLFDDLNKERASWDSKIPMDRLAYHFGEINALHPFREGNGRNQRSFLPSFSKHMVWKPTGTLPLNLK